MTMLLSMWVPHAAGVLQTRADEGEVGLTFNTFWARIKIMSNETKGPLSLPYNVFYMSIPVSTFIWILCLLLILTVSWILFG